jgi:heme/copper-type cytochrome/quinol oxidase subunit 2
MFGYPKTLKIPVGENINLKFVNRAVTIGLFITKTSVKILIMSTDT